MEELAKIFEEKKIISGKELSEYLSKYDIVVSTVFYDKDNFYEKRWNDDSVVEVISYHRSFDSSLLKVNIDCVDCTDCEDCFKCVSCNNCIKCINCEDCKYLVFQSNKTA